MGTKRRRINSASWKTDPTSPGLNRMIANERAENIQQMRELMQVMRETGPAMSSSQTTIRPISAGRKRAYSIKSKKSRVNKSFGSLFGSSKPEKAVKAEGRLYMTRTVSSGGRHHHILIPPEAETVERAATVQEPLHLYSDEKETYVSEANREIVHPQSYTNHYTHLQPSDESRPSTKDSPINLTAEDLGWSGAAFQRLSADDRGMLQGNIETNGHHHHIPATLSLDKVAPPKPDGNSLEGTNKIEPTRKHELPRCRETANHNRGPSVQSVTSPYENRRVAPGDIPKRSSSRSAASRQMSISQVMNVQHSTRPRRPTESSINLRPTAFQPEPEAVLRSSTVSTNPPESGDRSISSNVSSYMTASTETTQVFRTQSTVRDTMRQSRDGDRTSTPGSAHGPGPAPTRALPELPRGSIDTNRLSSQTIRPESQILCRRAQNSPVERLALSRTGSCHSDSMEEFMNMSSQEARAKRDRRRQHVTALKSKHTMSSRARNENQRLVLADVTAMAKTPAGKALIETSPIVPDSATIPPRGSKPKESPTDRHIRTPSDQERGIQQINRARAASQSELMEARTALLKAKRSSRRLSRSTDAARPGSSTAASSSYHYILQPRTPRPSARNNTLSPIILVFDQPPLEPSTTTIAPTVYQKKQLNRNMPLDHVVEREFRLNYHPGQSAHAAERAHDGSLAMTPRYYEPTPPRSPSNFGHSSSEDEERRRRMSDMRLNPSCRPEPLGRPIASSAPTPAPTARSPKTLALAGRALPPLPPPPGTGGIAQDTPVTITMTLAEFQDRVSVLVDRRLGRWLEDALGNLSSSASESRGSSRSGSTASAGAGLVAFGDFVHGDEAQPDGHARQLSQQKEQQEEKKEEKEALALVTRHPRRELPRLRLAGSEKEIPKQGVLGGGGGGQAMGRAATGSGTEAERRMKGRAVGGSTIESLLASLIAGRRGNGIGAF